MRENIDVIAKLGDILTKTEEIIDVLFAELERVRAFEMGNARTSGITQITNGLSKQLNTELNVLDRFFREEDKLAERLIALYSIEVNRRVSTVIRKILEHQDMDEEKVYEIEDEILKELSSAGAHDEKPA